MSSCLTQLQKSQLFGGMPASGEEEIQHKVEQVVHRIGSGQVADTVEAIRQIAAESDQFPASWLLKQQAALQTEDYSLLLNAFVNKEFIGRNGDFLIIAPHRMHREGRDRLMLSAIFGKVLSILTPSIEELENLLRDITGTLRQSIPLILPIISFATCGNFGENGVAFITPNSWDFVDGVQGPALNDMEKHRRRIRGCGGQCIQLMFEPKSAAFLNAPLEDEATGHQALHREFQYHDAGHATGLGIEIKEKECLFPSYWNGSVEEWRADGIEFELAARSLTPDEAGKLVAINLCIRLGVDAHRRGGLDRDVDVNASLLTLDRLFQSGELEVTDKGQLSLRELAYPALLRAVTPHRAEALSLTRGELNLEYPAGIHRLYGAIGSQSATRAIFKGLVRERCRGIWDLP